MCQKQAPETKYSECTGPLGLASPVPNAGGAVLQHGRDGADGECEEDHGAEIQAEAEDGVQHITGRGAAVSESVDEEVPNQCFLTY